jgi:hypothetical protein
MAREYRKDLRLQEMWSAICWQLWFMKIHINREATEQGLQFSHTTH